jgi:hypothetical protein
MPDIVPYGSPALEAIAKRLQGSKRIQNIDTKDIVSLATNGDGLPSGIGGKIRFDEDGKPLLRLAKPPSEGDSYTHKYTIIDASGNTLEHLTQTQGGDGLTDDTPPKTEKTTYLPNGGSLIERFWRDAYGDSKLHPINPDSTEGGVLTSRERIYTPPEAQHTFIGPVDARTNMGATELVVHDTAEDDANPDGKGTVWNRIQRFLLNPIDGTERIQEQVIHIREPNGIEQVVEPNGNEQYQVTHYMPNRNGTTTKQTETVISCEDKY